MSDVINVETLNELDKVLKDNETVVVKFTAPAWCVPCQRFAPHYEKAAENSDATFVAVDVDKAPWAMIEYGIQGVPTVKLFRSGEYERDLKERSAVKFLAEINN